MAKNLTQHCSGFSTDANPTRQSSSALDLKTRLWNSNDAERRRGIMRTKDCDYSRGSPGKTLITDYFYGIRPSLISTQPYRSSGSSKMATYHFQLSTKCINYNAVNTVEIRTLNVLKSINFYNLCLGPTVLKLVITSRSTSKDTISLLQNFTLYLDLYQYSCTHVIID